MLHRCLMMRLLLHLRCHWLLLTNHSRGWWWGPAPSSLGRGIPRHSMTSHWLLLAGYWTTCGRLLTRLGHASSVALLAGHHPRGRVRAPVRRCSSRPGTTRLRRWKGRLNHGTCICHRSQVD
uniref:Uncharacterized protein n=1 Tax=Ixodes ricinus TaxID=34613 RepID=A0A6B0UNV6_IXORI